MKEGWKTNLLLKVCKVYQPQTIATSKLIPGAPYDVFGANGCIGKYDQYNHEEDEILLTCRGATCGNINRSTPKSWINGNAMVVHPISDNIIKDFLMYALKSIDFSKVITGAAQPQITRVSLASVTIPIPPLPEQERIVSLLDAEFAKIDAIKANAEKQYGDTMALYKSALKDLLTPADDWKDSIINDVIDHGSNISYGIVQPGDNLTEGVPVVRPVDLMLNETLTSTKHFKKTSESISQAYSRTILNGKEILMCVRGTTGVVSLSSTVLKGCNVTRGIVPFKISDDILRKFIFYTFQAPIAFDFIQQYTQGAALKQINIKDVKNIPISLPPSKSDIENIVNRLDAISHLCYKLKSNYFTTVTLCNDLKQSILKDIFG